MFHHPRSIVSTLLIIPLVAGVSSLTPWQQAMAQTPTQPQLTIEQKAALAEATRLNQQIIQLYQQGKYAEATPLADQALAILKRSLGDRHPATAAILTNLAALYKKQGRNDEAKRLYQQVLELREEHYPLLKQQRLLTEAAELGRKILNLDAQGKYREALDAIAKRFLAVYAQLPPGYDNFAVSVPALLSLAKMYSATGQYQEAEQLNKQVLETVGAQAEHHKVDALIALASSYQIAGRYAEAEAIYQGLLKSSLRIAFTAGLRGLSDVYRRTGQIEKAEAASQNLLQELRSFYGQQLTNETPVRLGPDSGVVAADLSYSAMLHLEAGRYQDAEPLLDRAVQIFDKILQTKKHTLDLEQFEIIAWTFVLQGSVYQETARYPEAETFLKRGLVVIEENLGRNHLSVSRHLERLAHLYQRLGRYGEAEALLQRALTIEEQNLGNRSPGTASVLSDLAILYWSKGDLAQAIKTQTRSAEIQEFILSLTLTTGSERQKQDYAATLLGSTNTIISLHLQAAPTDSNAARLALTTALRRKGRILDVLSDNLSRLRRNLTPADQELLDQFTAARTQLATLYYGGLGDRTPEQYRTAMNTLQQQVTRLEADLNNRSAEFRTATQPITLAAVQAQIPTDAVLVELVQYKPFNPQAKSAERSGKPRYAAYLLAASGAIHAIDLGEAALIDQLAEDFRHALRRRESNVKPIARQLDTVLMQPIRAKLDSVLPSRPGDNTRKLLLSPDGQLNLIPFAALVDEQNRYLVETTEINYLTSGRDLLRLQNPVASRQPPVLVANPNYANPGNPQSIAQLPNTNPIAIASHSPISTRSNSQRSSDLAQLQFGPLPGTAAEAAAIAPKLPEVTLLTDTNATENALKQVQSPQILHIATHGFFLEDVPLVDSGTRGVSSLLRSDIIPTVAPGFRPPTRPGNPENALLRSGLALAGFNPRKSGDEDGVLTALEATGLDLRGTQLVVLSACETGVGDVANGEGVFGLRRAFVMAGAESQLISLWKVDDEGTKDLMVKYYDQLLANTGRSDALRQVQLAFLNSSIYRHPYFWAAFIPSGDWRLLKN